MTNPNFATDILTATADNYKPVAITKLPKVQKRADVPPSVTPEKKVETPVTQPVKTEDVPNEGGIELIPLEYVNVDRTYQRTEKPHAKKMSKDENWRPNAVGYPVINRRPDKSLWAIDGQQRISAMKKRGITHWPCRVVNLATVEEEAELFGVLNGSEGTQVSVSQTDRFRAMLAAKNEHALACVEAMQKGGLLLVPKRYPACNGHSDELWRQVDSTSFILNWAKVYGLKNVTRAARIITESWPQSMDCRRYLVVGAVFRLLGDFPDLDDDRAIAKFRSLPAIRVEQEAKKAKSLRASGGAPFLLEIYNKGLRSSKLQKPSPE